MAKSKNEYIKVRLGGHTLAALVIYSAIMMGFGAMMKSCNAENVTKREQVTKIANKQHQMTK